MEFIENKTFDEIQLNDSAEIIRTLTRKDIELFAIMSGDTNPAHLDDEYAQSDHFHKIIAHGMWVGALISTVLGTEVPGPGTIYVGQTLKFKKPVGLGDTVHVKVTVLEKDPSKKRITFNCTVTNQKQEEVVSGIAEVLAPLEKIHRPRIELPHVLLRKPGELYQAFINKLKNQKPLKTAIVHPVDRFSLQGAIDAAEAQLIEPLLIGNESRVRAVAEEFKISLRSYQIISAPYSHKAAEMAVELARQGEVQALMKGALHTDELMQAALDKEKGIRTARRMSHIAVMDVPNYSKPLLVTDAAINIYPTLEDKQDIIQNAIDLAHALDISEPKIALLSAIETVSEKIKSTLDAAALCKMAERGQIKGGILDGPLAFDNAISKEAADIKQIHSPVAGMADILVVPDLESGNMLMKQLEYFSDAQFAGVVLGGKVPIILTSRADKPLARIASCALASIFMHSKTL